VGIVIRNFVWAEDALTEVLLYETCNIGMCKRQFDGDQRLSAL
jgi:hypothetical protein